MKMNEFRLIKISRKFVATFRINNIPALVQIYIYRGALSNLLLVLPGLWLPLVTRSRLLHPLAALTISLASLPQLNIYGVH